MTDAGKPRFTADQKAGCARREVAQRRKVYPRLVVAGKMSADRAAREIAMMEEITADYDRLAMSGQLDVGSARSREWPIMSRRVLTQQEAIEIRRRGVAVVAVITWRMIAPGTWIAEQVEAR